MPFRLHDDGEFRRESICRHSWMLWLPIIAGAVLLYLPAYIDLATVYAHTEVAAQIPVCVAIWIWLIWKERSHFSVPAPSPAVSMTGWTLVVLAALMYIFGRSQEFYQLEIGSQIPLFVGSVWVLLGRATVRQLWFPPIFLLLLVPLPGSLINDVLVPLKKLVSSIVTDGLFFVGLPIARDGVVLYVGQYQLLIADACSGLNSMIALTAIGLLYVYVAGYRSWVANAALLVTVIPIAFVANIFRVTALVLITYVCGDEAGQRFHDFAAFGEILISILFFFCLDHTIQLWRPNARSSSTRTNGV